MNDHLRRCVLQTLAYFDIFSHPLTREETYRFSWSPNTLVSDQEQFFHIVDEMIQRKEVGQRGGYIFLQGRDRIVDQRERRVRAVEHKMRIAHRAIKKLRWIPFLRAVFICNQLPITAKVDSDIDVFIIVERGRLWLTRLLITLTLSVFRMRRHNAHVKDYLCLSFYVTTDALDLKQIAIQPPDIYLAYWIAWLIPAFDPDQYREKIYANNAWVWTYLPRVGERYAHDHRWQLSGVRSARWIQSSMEFLLSGQTGSGLECLVRRVQQNKMRRNTESKQRANTTDVIISDSMLKFHENDRRALYQRQWQDSWQRAYGTQYS